MEFSGTPEDGAALDRSSARPAGTSRYPLDFAASKIENSSSWRISKLSITLEQ